MQRVSTALSAEFSPDELEPKADEARRRALRRAFKILPWGVFLFVSGIIVVLIGSDIANNKIVETAGVIFILLGMLVGGLGFLNSALLEPRAAGHRENTSPRKPPEALPEAPFVIEVPSVTEVTTRALPGRERPTQRKGSDT